MILETLRFVQEVKGEGWALQRTQEERSRQSTAPAGRGIAAAGGRRALSTAGLGGRIAKEEGREEATEAREGNFCSIGVLCESKGKAGL